MKMVKKISILLSAILLTTGFQASYAAESIKVATVNVQQVIQQSPRVANLSKKLDEQFKSRQAKLGDLQKALQDKMDKFKKDEPTMSKKDRDATEKRLANERSDLIKQVVAYQQDVQKEQTRVMQGIYSDLTGIVSKIAKDQSYALVLDAQAVIFASDGNDITKDVASKFNDKA